MKAHLTSQNSVNDHSENSIGVPSEIHLDNNSENAFEVSSENSLNNHSENSIGVPSEKTLDNHSENACEAQSENYNLNSHSTSSSVSSEDDFDEKQVIKEFLNEQDRVCKDKEYTYFDQKNESDREEEEEVIDSKDCYKTQKEALNWNNISNLIISNAKYFGLSDVEARRAAVELHNLLITPFSTIRSLNCIAICQEYNFMNFWPSISGLEVKGIGFQNISTISFRLWSIPPSETGAERAFSKLKWKFPDRRNRVKNSTMMDEIYVDDAYQQRINDHSNFSETMWQLPQHME